MPGEISKNIATQFLHRYKRSDPRCNYDEPYCETHKISCMVRFSILFVLRCPESTYVRCVYTRCSWIYMLLELLFFFTSFDKYVFPSIEFGIIKKKVVDFWANNLEVRLLQKIIVAYIVLNTIFFHRISSAIHLFINSSLVWAINFELKHWCLALNH